MQAEPVIHNTFVIERSYPKPLETVFSAFSDPAKNRRWFAESRSHNVDEFVSNFQVGGVYLIRYHYTEGTPFEGVVMESEGSYRDIVPNRRVVFAATMTFGGKRISAALVTFEFLPTDQGTDLICTHQGAFFEGSDGPQIRETGWRVLFERLAEELGC